MFRSDSIGFLIKQVHDSIGRLTRQELKNTPVTRVQSDVMGWLLERTCQGRITRVGDVADFLGVRQPTASGIIHRMERAGFVELIQDKADKRALIIRVTDSTAHYHGESGRENIENILLNGMTEEQRGQLVQLLTTVKHNIDMALGEDE